MTVPCHAAATEPSPAATGDGDCQGSVTKSWHPGAVFPVMRFRPVLALLPLLAAPPAAAGSAGPDLPAGSAGPGLPAVPALAGPERERGLDCLALAIVHEAGQEPRAGQEAVAEVVLNRLAHPAYPKSICAVVFAGADRATGCQFSFTCDGSLRRVIAPARLAAARAVAAAVLDGRAVRHVPGAT